MNISRRMDIKKPNLPRELLEKLDESYDFPNISHYLGSLSEL
jgi:hypothetical protein